MTPWLVFKLELSNQFLSLKLHNLQDGWRIWNKSLHPITCITLGLQDGFASYSKRRFHQMDKTKSNANGIMT
jgi:hypothetical protein